MAKNFKLIATGSVGSGKTTMAKALSKLLNLELIPINEMVKKEKLGKKVGKEIEANLTKLKKSIDKKTKGKKNYIVEGHLACEFPIECDKIIVLRCNPKVLEKRLKKRKYPMEKIKDNALCEALDYCTIKAEENYPKGKIIEIDNTKPKTAKEIMKIIGQKQKPEKKISWLKSYLEKS